MLKFNSLVVIDYATPSVLIFINLCMNYSLSAQYIVTKQVEIDKAIFIIQLWE